MSRWKPDSTYTYGYARYEVLAGFVNAIFLVFVGVSIGDGFGEDHPLLPAAPCHILPTPPVRQVSVVFEALERLWEPPEIHGEHVLPVAVAGLLVNMVGLFFFHDSAHGHSHGGSHGHAHGDSNENMYGVWLHVLAGVSAVSSAQLK